MYALKLELKLNNKERTYLAQCAGYSRFVFNYALAFYNQIDHNEIKGSTSKKLDTIKILFNKSKKKEPELSWCNKYSSRIYQNAFRNLKTAFSRFHSNLGGYPNFKRKRNDCSFTVDSSNGVVLLSSGNKIKIPTLGTFRLKESLKFNCVSQTFTLSRKGDKWYVAFAIDAEKIPPILHEVVEPIGVDLGVKTFAVLNDGTTIESPMPYKKAKTKLAKTQSHNRHKQIGNRKLKIPTSNNAKKYFKQLAKKHNRVANVRQDFLHKTTTKLLKKYGHLKIENLNIKGMMSNHKLAGAMGDLGAYEFKRQLIYKAPWYATKVDIIDQWFPSSKTCSNCGCLKSDLTLKDRIFNCIDCGISLDRDLNAAINLKNTNENVIKNRVGLTRIYTPVDRIPPTALDEAGRKHHE
jgi:putative transposase